MFLCAHDPQHLRSFCCAPLLHYVDDNVICEIRTTGDERNRNRGRNEIRSKSTRGFLDISFGIRVR